MIELLGFFVAYQCLAFIPPAKSPGPTHAAKLGDTSQVPTNANVSKYPPTATSCQLLSTDNGTPALECTVGAGETTRIWRDGSVADPNDRIEPADSETAFSGDVE